MTAQHEEGCYEKNVFPIFLVCKGLYRTMTSGRQRGAVFQQVRPGAGFETGDFVEENMGGLP